MIETYKNKGSYQNQRDTYQILIKGTDRVVATFRLKCSARDYIHILKKIYKEEMEIKQVKDKLK